MTREVRSCFVNGCWEMSVLEFETLRFVTILSLLLFVEKAGDEVDARETELKRIKR
jgi:hypothetical protein